MIIVKIKQFAGESWKLVRMITGGALEVVPKETHGVFLVWLPGGTSWEAAAGERVLGTVFII